MNTVDLHNFAERAHDYSSLFSYASWTKTLDTGVPSDILNVFKKYDEEWGHYKELTYLNYLSWVYRYLLKNYRNEYIYKNELINKYIYKHFGRSTSVAVNEFRVANAVADLVLFNGESKCFEIKSDLDSPQRLSNQLDYFQRIFEQCYILVPVDTINEYKKIVDDRIGLLTLRYCANGQVSINMERQAMKIEMVDVDVLMCSVRAAEYRWMVKQAYGKMPDVSDFEMFEACREQLKHLTSEQLHLLFREAIKLRKSKVSVLKNVPPIFRQMSLSLNLNDASLRLLENLSQQKIVS